MKIELKINEDSDRYAAPAPCRSGVWKEKVPYLQARVRRSRTECRRAGPPERAPKLLAETAKRPEARGRRVGSFWGLAKHPCPPEARAAAR